MKPVNSSVAVTVAPCAAPSSLMTIGGWNMWYGNFHALRATHLPAQHVRAQLFPSRAGGR